MPLSPDIVRTWLERWDRQQEGYLPDREEIFAVIADAVQAGTASAHPLVLDLGCGPGSLGARIRQRIPGARVVGVDSDPVLLALAGAAYEIELVDHDLADGGWVDALPVAGPFDAIVSTTALHWLAPERLGEVYAQAGRLLRSGGILLNGDNMPESDAAILDLQRELVRRRIARAGLSEAENWAEWWAQVQAEPEFADAVAERGRRSWIGPQRGNTGYDTHLSALRAAGFGTVGTVWQYGERRILAAVKA